MILFPRDNPVIESLNSYYVDIRKMFEHFQGQIDSGAIHFKAPSMEGVIFFDETEALSGMLETSREVIHGEAAAEKLIDAVSKINFTLGVFEIPSEKIFFWTRMPDARPIHDNLSAEFTDLAGLVKKMKAEKLTGVIDVKEGQGDPAGIILFESGEILDVYSPLIESDISPAAERLLALVDATRNGGTSFSVRQILPRSSSTAAAAEASGSDAGDGGGDLRMLEELIDIFERAVTAQKKDFTNLFRRKCIDNAERFDFLDPFVGEFEYADNRIHFSGDVEEGVLTRGLLDVLAGLADDLHISDQIRHAMRRWEGRWETRLNRYNIRL